MIESASLPFRSDQVLVQESSGTLVLLNLESGKYYSLDEVGGRVWELSDGIRTVEDIVIQLCQEYDQSAEIVRTDVLELLQDLADERIITDRR
jgi:Coenzyme PQQ synthesis protein D (PqqD)